MKIAINPSQLTGTLTPPSSKSHSIRALFFAALAEGESKIDGLLESPDTLAALQAIQQFGAKVQGNLICGTNGKLQTPQKTIDSGNSGLVYRFSTAFAGLCSGQTTITGDHSIQFSRPILPLLQSLTNLGIATGQSPVRIQGPWKGGSTSISTDDSQLLSALLIAAPFAASDTWIDVPHIGEKPWIQVTLNWLDRMGIHYTRDEFRKFHIPGNQSIQSFTYTVPADFSSAAYPIASAILTDSKITIKGLDLNDSQGDKALLNCLQQMGANISINEDVIVHPGQTLKGRSIDMNDFIDALPILAVIGCFAEGETRLYNAAITRQKESDRIACITQELRKMGADIEELPDGMIVRQSSLKGASVQSHRDHRIGMALAVAALACEGETVIDGIECIAKSYPKFFEDLEKVTHENCIVRL